MIIIFRKYLKLLISIYMFFIPITLLIINIFIKNILIKYYLWLIIPELLFYSVDLIVIYFDKFDLRIIIHHLLGYLHNYLLYTYIHKTWILYTLYISFFLYQGCVIFSILYVFLKNILSINNLYIYKLKLIKITKYLLILKLCFTICVVLNNNLLGYLKLISNIMIIFQLCLSYFLINKDIRTKIKFIY